MTDNAISEYIKSLTQVEYVFIQRIGKEVTFRNDTFNLNSSCFVTSSLTLTRSLFGFYLLFRACLVPSQHSNGYFLLNHIILPMQNTTRAFIICENTLVVPLAKMFLTNARYHVNFSRSQSFGLHLVGLDRWLQSSSIRLASLFVLAGHLMLHHQFLSNDDCILLDVGIVLYAFTVLGHC